jgi:hypothetical protein
MSDSTLSTIVCHETLSKIFPLHIYASALITDASRRFSVSSGHGWVYKTFPCVRETVALIEPESAYVIPSNAFNNRFFVYLYVLARYWVLSVLLRRGNNENHDGSCWDTKAPGFH